MYQDLPIQDIYAREILDSRGNPTVEVEILAGEKIVGRAAVPSGASTGKFEAVELRDREKRYGGKGVEQAVRHVNEEIAEALIGKNVLAQTEIDHILKELDGSIDKHNLGANAILGVSLAAAKTAAAALRIPLYDYLGNVGEKVMPIPMMNVLNGGAHADNNLDIQEFMLVPYGSDSFKERLRMGTEIYHVLRTLLKQKGLTTAVGDEGGFAPELRDSREAIEFLIEAAHQAGYQPGKDVGIALDVAASEIYRAKEQRYYFVGESKKSGKKIARTSDEMMEYYERLILDYPIYSIEDPLDEEDWDGWSRLTAKIGEKVQLVGDDLFVTNPERVALGIAKKAANSVLIKVNQIGTLTEAARAVELAHQAGYRTIMSHRSGETEDTTIADLAWHFIPDRSKPVHRAARNVWQNIISCFELKKHCGNPCDERTIPERVRDLFPEWSFYFTNCTYLILTVITI